MPRWLLGDGQHTTTVESLVTYALLRSLADSAAVVAPVAGAAAAVTDLGPLAAAALDLEGKRWVRNR